VRQRDIDDRNVRSPRTQDFQRRLCGQGSASLISVAFKNSRERQTDNLLVIDDEDPASMIHATRLHRGWSSPKFNERRAQNAASRAVFRVYADIVFLVGSDTVKHCRTGSIPVI
jgi:hypothetical protein